jgi:hypothetical protein
MVRRGSTVRVRQRACKIPAQAGFFVQEALLLAQRAAGMGRSVELSDTRVDRFCAKEEVTTSYAGPEAASLGVSKPHAKG